MVSSRLPYSTPCWRHVDAHFEGAIGSVEVVILRVLVPGACAASQCRLGAQNGKGMNDASCIQPGRPETVVRNNESTGAECRSLGP